MQILTDGATLATSTTLATIQPLNEETSRVKIFTSAGGPPWIWNSTNDLENPIQVTKWVSNEVSSNPYQIPPTDPEWIDVYKLAL